MWVELTVVDHEGNLTQVPVNMATIVTFAKLNDPAYQKASAILYPSGGQFISMPVTATFEELKELIL